MEVVYSYTQAFRDCVCGMPADVRGAVEEAVNALGSSLLADIDADRPELHQPAQLVLKHGYTPTLCIMTVAGQVDVVLCYDQDDVRGHIEVSLLDATSPTEAHARFLMVAKALYGPLLLGAN